MQSMDKRAPEILSLRQDIEREVKRQIRTPYDFEFLAGVIWERLHENISPTTLKRLWGYIDGADTTGAVRCACCRSFSALPIGRHISPPSISVARWKATVLQAKAFIPDN